MVDTNGNPTSYKCQINEYQRNMLIKAIVCMMAHQRELLQREEGDVETNMYIEAEMFLGMLLDLRSDERQHPDILHGLCL